MSTDKNDRIRKVQELETKTKSLSIRMIRLVQALPFSEEARIVGRQVLRSATSTGANYRAVSRNKSAADKLNKLKIVLEEADETAYWLEIISEAELLDKERVQPLWEEYMEVVRMISKAIQNLKN